MLQWTYEAMPNGQIRQLMDVKWTMLQWTYETIPNGQIRQWIF